MNAAPIHLSISRSIFPLLVNKTLKYSIRYGLLSYLEWALHTVSSENHGGADFHPGHFTLICKKRFCPQKLWTEPGTTGSLGGVQSQLETTLTYCQQCQLDSLMVLSENRLIFTFKLTLKDAFKYDAKRLWPDVHCCFDGFRCSIVSYEYTDFLLRSNTMFY